MVVLPVLCVAPAVGAVRMVHIVKPFLGVSDGRLPQFVRTSGFLLEKAQQHQTTGFR